MEVAMTTLRSAFALALAGSVLAAPPPAAAQDVQYESVTRIELPGMAGRAMRVAARLGGGSMETVETTYIKGRKMRSDSDKTSIILDLEAQRWISIDHTARTYSTLTFDELSQRARQATAQARQDGRQVSGQGDGEAHFNFRFSVDPANERQRVAGYNAERFFLTMAAEGEYVPEDGGAREQAGTLVVLTDMWTSREVPVFQARSAFDDASARHIAEAGAAITEGIAAAFADDPRMKVAFEQSVSEARKIEGMAVRTVTSFVGVAPGHQFDRALLTDPRPQGPSAARQAGRAALGRLGAAAAAAAGGRQQEEAAAADQPTQATIFTVTSEIRNVQTRSLDAKLFEAPEGYRQVAVDGSE
jgi:hypothetical protein